MIRRSGTASTSAICRSEVATEDIARIRRQFSPFPSWHADELVGILLGHAFDVRRALPVECGPGAGATWR